MAEETPRVLERLRLAVRDRRFRRRARHASTWGNRRMKHLVLCIVSGVAAAIQGLLFVCFILSRQGELAMMSLATSAYFTWSGVEYS